MAPTGNNRTKVFIFECLQMQTGTTFDTFLLVKHNNDYLDKQSYGRGKGVFIYLH